MNGFTIAGIAVIGIGFIVYIVGRLMEQTEWELLVPLSYGVIVCGIFAGGVGIAKNYSQTGRRESAEIKHALMAALPELHSVTVNSNVTATSNDSEVSFRVGSGPSAVECETGVKLVHGKVVIQEQTDYRAPLPQACQHALLPIPRE